MKQTYLCEIVSINEIAEQTFDLRFSCEEMARQAKTGQFVHIKCANDVNTLLRRPISICDVEGDVLRVIFEVRGEGTALLSLKKPGEFIDVMGPLGHGFEPTDEKCAVIGGGIGTFPLLMLAKSLKSPDIYIGFRNKERVLLEDAFAQAGNLTIATDDGSYGYHGFAIDKLKENISGVKKIYACGPTPMLKAVQALCAEHGIEGEISMEERMGCGIGACLTCACKANGHYAHVCKDGPVFKASEVNFDE